LWRALSLAAKGLPIGLRSPEYSRSVQSFIKQLYRIEAAPQAVENVYIYNLNSNRITRVMVDRHQGVYARP
jgi:hypothetical protein